MERMRVSDVKTFLVGGSWRNWLVVKLNPDSGIHGVGEATLEGKSKTVEAAVHELSRYLVGKEPFAIERHFQEMYRRAFYAGGEVLTSAISGVETALWNIKGKALGVPGYELLGGRTRDSQALRQRLVSPGHGSRLVPSHTTVAMLTWLQGSLRMSRDESEPPARVSHHLECPTNTFSQGAGKT